MSTTDESLKAGPKPAIRVVGGMRVPPHKSNKNKDTRMRSNSENDVEEPSTSPKQHLVISGAGAKSNEDFPPGAIQAFHEKPEPSHLESHNNNKKYTIFQPNKQF